MERTLCFYICIHEKIITDSKKIGFIQNMKRILISQPISKVKSIRHDCGEPGELSRHSD
jgi:hypothetical protein